jgi:hypothetical protein
MLIVSFLMVSVAAQGFPIDVHMSADLPLQSFPIGQATRVLVNVTNLVDSTVQLEFVGLRFEWNAPTRFFIGGNSDKGAVLAARQQLTYPINVDVPNNATPGTHKLSAYVSYRWIERGNWTGILSNTWVADVQLAYPQTQQSQTTQVGPVQSPSLGTIGALFFIAAVVVLLYSERGRLFHKSRGPTKRERTKSRS